MIIIDIEGSASKHGDDVAADSSHVHTGSAQRPSFHAPISHPSPPPDSYPKQHPAGATPTVALVVVPYRQSPVRRFWNAFAVALLLYLALFTLTHNIVRMARAGARRWDDGAVGAPRPEDGIALTSIGSHDWTTYNPHPRWAPTFAHSAETSFVLPADAHALYLISRGSYQSGKVQVRQSTTRGDEVAVDVRVAYDDAQALARAVVCRLHQHGGREGVGIYTPTPGWSDARDRLYVEVVVTLPAAPSDGTPLHIRRLATDTSNLVQELGDLWQSVLFDEVALTTSNARIHVESITLVRGSVTSSNGPIVGHFNTSDTLVLRTNNAAIQATASLFNAGRDTTRLEMRTSNGSITSWLSLATESGSGGRFDVQARSSNGAVSVQYDDAPLNARLTSEARTSNGPVSVLMHPAYEGTYEVSTSNSRPMVRDTQPRDPSGAGRRRVVEQTRAGNVVSGRVFWEGRGGMGRSTVSTSNARASLDL